MKSIVISAFLLSTFCIGSSASAEKQVALSARHAAEMLGQAAGSRWIRAGHQQILRSIILGQSYESRSSVLGVQCKANWRGDMRTCVFRIGTDNLLDDDRGWGAVYELTIESDIDDSQMASAVMELVAG